jgi:hypothetical protein
MSTVNYQKKNVKMKLKKFEDLVRCSARRLQTLFVSRGFTMKFLKELLELENDVNPPFGNNNPPTIYIPCSFPHDKWKAAFDELQEAQQTFFAHRFDEASDRIRKKLCLVTQSSR